MTALKRKHVNQMRPDIFTYMQIILPFANPGSTTVAFGYNASNSGKTPADKLLKASEDLFNSSAENGIVVFKETIPDKVTEKQKKKIRIKKNNRYQILTINVIKRLIHI